MESGQLKHKVMLPNGEQIPALGQGTWFLGEHKSRINEEKSLKQSLYTSSILKKIAEHHHAGISQVLLAWVIRDGNTVAIPRTGQMSHAIENAGADAITLTEEELSAIDKAYPAPNRKVYLDMQ